MQVFVDLTTRLLAVILFVGFVFQCNAVTQKITQYQEIDQAAIDQDTLILLDIDNTIFRSAKHYGSVEFFDTLLADIIAKENIPKMQANFKVYDRWVRAQKHIDTKLIDEKIHAFIERARASKATIIAFTARNPPIADVTYEQLSKHRVHFDQLDGIKFETHYKLPILTDKKWCEQNPNQEACSESNKNKHVDSKSVFYKGILFSDLGHKGTVFKDFYQTYIKHKASAPKRVIFVDDKAYNLDSMSKAVLQLGLKFHGYHIVDGFKYDHKIALQEESASS